METANFHLMLNHNGEAVISTIDLSKLLGRRHHDLLRSIDVINCSPEFRERNFHVDSYQLNGKKCRMFQITQSGFGILPLNTQSKFFEIYEMLIKEYELINYVKKSMYKFLLQEILKSLGVSEDIELGCRSTSNQNS